MATKLVFPPPILPGISSLNVLRRERMHNAGMIPYKDTPPRRPASSSATRKTSLKPKAIAQGGSRARMIATVRRRNLVPLSFCCNSLSASSTKSTSDNEAPVMLEPMALREKSSSKSPTTDLPACLSTSSTFIPETTVAVELSTMPSMTPSHRQYRHRGMRQPPMIALFDLTGSFPRFDNPTSGNPTPTRAKKDPANPNTKNRLKKSEYDVSKMAKTAKHEAKSSDATPESRSRFVAIWVTIIPPSEMYADTIAVSNNQKSKAVTASPTPPRASLDITKKPGEAKPTIDGMNPVSYVSEGKAIIPAPTAVPANSKEDPKTLPSASRHLASSPPFFKLSCVVLAPEAYKFGGSADERAAAVRRSR
ncbi:hypothetical protein THAOC_32280 [Thalassiosira oceanica]|uniref:Uncharacterized protein n=1 Tax=Thalassiosira oceanica TaxID=159749 RepID=K0RIX5_THAOC|nr:hypothetical protein THAOC_32280 [Thalassiosira oceanica]|eukprot:EJK48886.1 hypothetical protein THAOC_32280 [Thalassiosira oceanica]